MVKNINHALVARAHTPMFLMHKYWARKPHNVVREYVEAYSKPGEIVLDPFVGSGVTAIEAMRSGRKAVAIDLSPVAIFVTRNTLMPMNLAKYAQVFSDIEEKVSDTINGFYKTKCTKCGEVVPIICTHFDNSTPIKIMYECACGTKKNKPKKMSKIPDPDDLALVDQMNNAKIPYWYPTTRLFYDGSPFMKKEKCDSIPDLFTRRNLLALALLYSEIEKIPNKAIREFMLFTFTSMVHLASKMTPVRPTREYSSFWGAAHSYWVPPLNMESNVWMLFESAAKGRQGVLKGKKDSNATIGHCAEARTFTDLHTDANMLMKAHNALELTQIIPKASVDYIFTDPPYGGAVQYFELSTLWASWLKMDMNYSEEITVNRQQKKDFDFYHKMLKAAFREMYQILKPDRYMTVTFHSTDIKVWNSIVKAAVMSGFDLEKIIYQPPARPSAKGLLQPYGSAVGDYYMRFRKPASEKLVSEKAIDIATYEREVVFAAKGILERRGEPTIFQHILNGIMVDLKGGRYAPIGARGLEDILADHVGKEFELIDVKDKRGKVVGKKWWLKDRDFSNFTTPALGDRVERAILSVLDKKVKASFDDILQTVFIDFPNALTPESDQIKSILEEYAKQTPDGKWMLKPGLSENERVSAHTTIIYMLANLGKKAEYDIWIGKNEQAANYKGKPLSELCDDIRVFKFVPQEDAALDRIKQIDVLWIEDGKIAYEFEVENTTSISEAIIRGSNIPDSLKPHRFIIIPKERENFLYRKLQEPVLLETMKKVKWSFLTYDDVQDFFSESKKQVNLVKLNNMARAPRMKNSEQKNISDF